MTVRELENRRKPDVCEERSQHPIDLRLRLQAQQIIEEVLAGVSPWEEEARTLLRQQVEEHPGRPERALLVHLLTVPRP